MAREALSEQQIPISTVQDFRVFLKKSKEEIPESRCTGIKLWTWTIQGGRPAQETRASSSFIFQKKGFDLLFS